VDCFACQKSKVWEEGRNHRQLGSGQNSVCYSLSVEERQSGLQLSI